MKTLAAAIATILAITAAALLTATPALAVVGGTDTSTVRHPWMVFLRDDARDPELSGHFCGGALVAPTKVVTAAHCIDDLRPEDFQVVAGRTDLRTDLGDVRGVRDVWFAPKLPVPPGDPRMVPGGDLAVLTLDAPLPQRPIRLVGPGDGRLYRPGTPAMLLGWGIHVEEGLIGPSPVLQKARFPMIDFSTCDAALRAHPVLPGRLDPDSSVCGGAVRAGGASGCGGDSGGPLVIAGRLAGVFGPIVSRHGFVCQDAYSGFTRLDVYSNLLREQITRP